MPQIEMRGPFFRNRKNIVDSVTKRFIQYAVELGEQRLDEMLRPRPAGVYLSVQAAQTGQGSTGNYRRNVSGRVQGSKGVIDDGNVVYGPWLEGTSSRNATTPFKGYASFRKTSDWLQKEVYTRKKQWEREYARKLNGI